MMGWVHGTSGHEIGLVAVPLARPDVDTLIIAQRYDDPAAKPGVWTWPVGTTLTANLSGVEGARPVWARWKRHVRRPEARAA